MEVMDDKVRGEHHYTAQMVVELRQQLAAATAREAVLREALHRIGTDYHNDRHSIWAREALATPSPAAEAMLALCGTAVMMANNLDWIRTADGRITTIERKLIDAVTLYLSARDHPHGL
jgi:hypothetical protein